MNKILLFLIIFIILILFFYGFNFILKRNIENYGLYCGRYNLLLESNRRLARKHCIRDTNCKWTKINDTGDGKTIHYCTDKPANATTIKDILQEIEEQITPCYTYSSTNDTWYKPVEGNNVGNWDITNVTSNTSMSVSFWINIAKKYSTCRNIFNVTNGIMCDNNYSCVTTDNNDNNSSVSIPAIWVPPNSTNLTIRFSSNNNNCQGTGSFSCTIEENTSRFITVTFNDKTIIVYVNGSQTNSFTLDDSPIAATSDSELYIGDPCFVNNNLTIKDFSFYNDVLTSNEASIIYKQATYS